MLRKTVILIGLIAIAAILAGPGANAQDNLSRVDREYDPGYDRYKVDRYLDIEVWTNHPDGDFYIGDNVVINFRTNRDAFVAIYTIDSRGRVNLLFPTAEDASNFVEGGVSYSIPSGRDDFDLVVTGPEGVEHIQAIASREQFPIPDWFPTSGLICDWDDRFDFMDYVNTRYFLGYPGQRYAFDRSSLYVNEWEPEYFRPVYYPYYPNWTVTGNVYIDYPWGASVYINGIYWGVTPLYVPRIYVGWHTFTVYDRWGYCWEHDIHITRYNTIVLDRTIVHTSPRIRSKYKEVHSVGYRDPVKHGYPDFHEREKVMVSKTARSAGSASGGPTVEYEYKSKLDKKYVRGTTQAVKTDRGYESTGAVNSGVSKTKGYSGTVNNESKSTGKDYYQGSSSKSGGTYDRGKATGSSKSTYDRGSSSGKSAPSSDYYQKKSGTSQSKGDRVSSDSRKSKSSSSSGKSSSGSYQKSSPSKSGGSSSGNVSKGSKSAPSKSSGSSKSGSSGGQSKGKGK